jgi:hypothetical protein
MTFEDEAHLTKNKGKDMWKEATINRKDKREELTLNR